ncbi:aldehyde oxidase 3-like [Anopheles nili]|uniref:aldehyde oxidase 3-like n=1 Tax=Anopheles nili TaxID=185578 RepID=UPI00237AF8E1|nr:aldehyde oxidase 3-like [Anopheles nili]
MQIVFTINGKVHKVNSGTVPVDTSLGTFLRYHVQLKGTKFMCREGGCGACIVNISGQHPVTKEITSRAVNSCLYPLFSCNGLDIVTIEGVGNKLKGYHATQRRLAHFNGTQCGFCSPGMVMNMYSLLETKNGQVTMEEVENSFGGNICRCTGYRAILDAFKSLAVDATPALLAACQDIEDVPRICSKSQEGKPCTGVCSMAAQCEEANDIHLTFAGDREWYKVDNVQTIFRIFEKIGTRSYMLVAGNTGTGVYRRPDDLEVFIDISSVADLRVNYFNDAMVIGANVTLSELMEILNEASTTNGYEYCREIVKHLDLIANVPVRNVGTIAGNLSIKHKHREFPSDVYLLLEGVGARLTIASSTTSTKIVTVEEYLSMNMSKRIILNLLLYPLDPAHYVLRTYKIMPRAQNAHAYVNAVFLLQFQTSELRTASICYGGITPGFTHAVQLESFLVGKDIFQESTFEAALELLGNTITPNFEAPDATPEYRKQLTLALFYRAIISIAQERGVSISHFYASGAELPKRMLSSGQQSYDTIQDNWPVTKNMPKVEGLSQTAGEADYTDDIPNLPEQLFGAFVLATKPRTTILRVDATEALSRNGVVAFYSAKDIPGTNNFMPVELGNNEVEEIFCSTRVLYHGQPIGVILAESFEDAYRAAKLVDIEYSEQDDQPILPTVQDVMRAEATDRIHPSDEVQEGEGYASGSGPIRLEGSFDLPSQYHLSMETQQCVCVPIDDGMDVYSSTQWVDICQIAIARALCIPENSLNFRIRRLGGAFGSKISRASQIASACAIAAHFSQRPVRLIMTLEDNMAAIGKRSACASRYEIEVDERGRVQRLLNRFYQDSGCSLNEPVEKVTFLFYRNCYDTSRWKVLGHSVLTESASSTYCRGPGTNEGISMAENLMEHIAHRLKLDPLAVRMQNLAEDSKIRELLPIFSADVEYETRRREIERYNETNRWIKRGIAIVPMRYPQYFVGTLHALVSIYHADGTVAITSGGIDMGQGVNTKITQVAARTLGIPVSMIRVKAMANITSPNAIVSGGSMTSDAACYAVKMACEILRKRIDPVRERHPGETWETITQRCHQQHVDLCALYQYNVTEMQHYVVWGLACSELEVDILTGNVQIRRVDLLEDVGESISPGIDIGQIEGAFVMGIGLYFTEQLVYSGESGQLLTNRSWNYKPPGAKDIPVDFRVKFLQRTHNENFVLRSKTTGEPALNMTVSLLFALRMALNSARQQAGLSDEWYPIEVPATPEQICLLAGTKIDQLKLTQN